MTFSQKKKNIGFVKIENLVEFTVDSVISNPPVDIMVFTLKVTNKTDKPIPDLGVSNRSKNVNFYINGQLDNPRSLYNGLEAIGGDKTIRINESQTCGATWTIPGAGLIKKYGNEFTIQWEYMGQKSIEMAVNIKKKTALPIRNCLVPNK